MASVQAKHTGRACCKVWAHGRSVPLVVSPADASTTPSAHQRSLTKGTVAKKQPDGSAAGDSNASSSAAHGAGASRQGAAAAGAEGGNQAGASGSCVGLPEETEADDARRDSVSEEDSAMPAAEAAAEERRRSGQQAGVSGWMDARRTVRLIRGPGGRVMRAGESGSAPAEEVGLRSSPRYVSRASRGPQLASAPHTGAQRRLLEPPCPASCHAPTSDAACAAGQPHDTKCSVHPASVQNAAP